MKKLFIILAVLLSATLSAQEYTWKTVKMDASRTGCVTPMGDNLTNFSEKAQNHIFENQNSKKLKVFLHESKKADRFGSKRI